MHNFTTEFVEFFDENYGIHKEDYYCPSVNKQRANQSMNQTTWPDLLIASYNYWVPRIASSSGMEIPPPPFTVTFTVFDATDFRGPRKTTDAIAKKNPVITDAAAAPKAFLPPNKLGDCKNVNVSNSLGSHYWGGYLEMTNQAFADTHVEKVKADDMKPRYGYGTVFNIWR